MRTIARSWPFVHYRSETPSRSRLTRRTRTWRPSRLPPGALRPFALASDRRRRPPTDPPPSEPPSTLPGGAPPSPPPAAPPPAEKLTLDREAALQAMSFYPTILAWARRFGVPFHDAHDVTMEVVIRAAERWDAFELRADEHPRAARRVWLFVFTYRAAAAWRRSAAHARVEPRDPADMEAFAGQGEHHRSPEQAALDHESERTAGAALAALRPETSAENWRVLLAHEVQGVPVKALATLEGVSPSIIYYRLCSARRDLRAAIQRLRARVAFEQTSAKRRGSR